MYTPQQTLIDLILPPFFLAIACGAVLIMAGLLGWVIWSRIQRLRQSHSQGGMDTNISRSISKP